MHAWSWAVWSVGVVLGAGPEPATDARMERKKLVPADAATQWSAAESSGEVARVEGGERLLHWHVPVDHFAGEAKYPIGWPRINYAWPATARDWSGWDYLRFRVEARTSREGLPREPVSMAIYTPDNAGAYRRTLSELVKNKPAEIRIPLTQVPKHQDARQIQFSISESRYAHGDALDFYISDIELLRYAKPTLLEFAPESQVIFSDAKQLAVRFALTGVRAGEVVDVTCELKGAGGVLASARARARLARGGHRVVLDLGEALLRPGEYEVTARAGEESVTSRVRVVGSPFSAEERQP